MRTCLVTLAVLVAGLAAAASASAATVERTGDVIGFTAAQGDKVDLTVRAGNSSIRSLVFTKTLGATGFTVRPGCSGAATSASCLITFQAVAAKRLRFSTVGGDDRIDASNTRTPFDASLPEEFATGDGADVLRAGPLDDVVRAGPGGDLLTGGPGADELFGEDGADTFVGIEGADRIDGGPGTDLLDVSDATGGVAVSLNGSADDGPLGTGADVDVEEVLGSPFQDLLTGGAAPDQLSGGGGDDVVDVRDGGADIVDCGPGSADRAIVDGSDTVSGCELVEAPPPAPPAPSNGPGPADPNAPPAGNAPGAPARASVIAARLSFGWLGFREGTQADELRASLCLPPGAKQPSRCGR